MAFALLSSAAITEANGQPPTDVAARQEHITDILTRMPLDQVARRRELCAAGISGESDAAVDRAMGTNVSARLAEECLAFLTRLGWERRLEPVHTQRAPAPSALDAGFVQGFRQGGAMPAGLPELRVLKPVAQRCFAQQEANTRLCSATGMAIGVQVYHGFFVRADY